MTFANTYPVFEADQVLTNDHLNSMFNYLDQQDRLTRMKLIGSGIVCGLEIEPAGSEIKVKKGCAVTSQGFMVLHCETVYTHYIPYSTPVFPDDLQLNQQCPSERSEAIPFYGETFGREIFQLIADQDVANHNGNTDLIALSQMPDDFLSKYAIVLFLEAEQLNLKNCDTNDCNDKGSRMNFQVKALLVDKNILDKIISGQGGNLAEIDKNIYPILKRFNYQVQKLTTSSDVINAFKNLADHETLTTIAAALKNSARKYQYLLENENPNIFDTVYNRLVELRDEILRNHPVLIQYFYDFLDDIIKGYYEFTRAAQHTNSECCMDEMKFPLHIMLGEANVSTSNSHASYRQYFIYSPLFNDQKNRLGEIRSLFTRLKLLLSQFSIESMLPFDKKQIRITPSQWGKANLSDRCIPYYYNVAEPQNELYKFWNYEKAKRGEETHNLSYNASSYNAPFHVTNSLLYDIEPFNFFRIEGHIGKHINEALPMIKQQQKERNQPWEVVAVSADFIGTLIRGEEPKCIIQDLESDYRVLIAEFVCRLHDAFCKVGRTEYKPASIFTSVVAASNMVNRVSNTSSVSSEMSATATLLSSITREEEEEETKILKTSLAINPDTISHPFVSSLVSEFHLSKAYRKGDTLSRLCRPTKDTVGAAYLSIIARNNGQFKNPITISTSILGTFLRNVFFELIDSIESMFAILMNNELADLNIISFKTAYDRYEKAIGSVETRLLRIGINTQIFLSTCIIEKLEALKNEYLRRTAQYRLAKNLGHYFDHHGGVEHKAGVPTGGTFILAYHEQRKGHFFDVGSILVNKELSTMLVQQFPALLQKNLNLNELESKTQELQTATQFKDPELFLRLNDVVGKYLNECADLPDERRKALEAIIKLPPQRTSFELTDGMVIADFYVPYLCCSDCPPIAYILPPPPVTEDQTPVLRIAKESFCNSDQTEFAITALPAGGNLEGDGVKRRADGNFVFVPGGLNPGSYTIKYTMNQKTASATVQVHTSPEAKFTTIKTVGDGLMKVEINNESSGTTAETTYLWLIDGEKFSEKKDPESISFKLQTLPHTIILRLNNSGCFAEYEEKIQLETISKTIQVCSSVPKHGLESNLPSGSTIEILENEGGIMNEHLVIFPSAINITETTTFKVSYILNGRQTDILISVIFVNANFFIELKRSAPTRRQVTTLTLSPIDPTITSSEWQIKQGNNVITKTDKTVTIDIDSSHMTLGRDINITHAVKVVSGQESCGQKKVFKLTSAIAEIKLNQGQFTNDFTIG